MTGPTDPLRPTGDHAPRSRGPGWMGSPDPAGLGRHTKGSAPKHASVRAPMAASAHHLGQGAARITSDTTPGTRLIPGGGRPGRWAGSPFYGYKAENHLLNYIIHNNSRWPLFRSDGAPWTPSCNVRNEWKRTMAIGYRQQRIVTSSPIDIGWRIRCKSPPSTGDVGSVKHLLTTRGQPPAEARLTRRPLERTRSTDRECGVDR